MQSPELPPPHGTPTEQPKSDGLVHVGAVSIGAGVAVTVDVEIVVVVVELLTRFVMVVVTFTEALAVEVTVVVSCTYVLAFEYTRKDRVDEDLTVVVGVEIMQEHAVAMIFEARSFRAVSSAQGFADVVDEESARSWRRLSVRSAGPSVPRPPR